MVWAPSGYGRVAILKFRDVVDPTSTPPHWSLRSQAEKAIWATSSANICQVGWMSQTPPPTKCTKVLDWKGHLGQIYTVLSYGVDFTLQLPKHSFWSAHNNEFWCCLLVDTWRSQADMYKLNSEDIKIIRFQQPEGKAQGQCSNLIILKYPRSLMDLKQCLICGCECLTKSRQINTQCFNDHEYLLRVISDTCWELLSPCHNGTI